MAETIGRYRLLGAIGRGEVSVVHKAFDPLADRLVAIKTFTNDFAPNSADAREWQAQLQREVEAASRLKSPRIVAVFDAGSESDQSYVVMEYIEGETLAEAIRRGDLALSQKLGIIDAVAEGLAAAHALGIVHHHLRPSNILLTKGMGAKVSDFGLARLSFARGEATPSPGPLRIHYRSPEQIYGKKADERTDVFALGIISYELLLGRKPFDGQSWIQITQKILNVDPPFLRESSSEIPAALARFLARALAKNPLDRFQSPLELRKDLHELAPKIVDTASGVGFLPPISSGSSSSSGAASPTDGPYLLVEEDGFRRSVSLGGNEFTIGRRNDRDLPLRDEHISRSHAKIVHQGDEYRLVDTASKHGTYLNGQPVQQAVLSDGDRIELGKSPRFRLYFRTGSGESDTLTPPVVEPLRGERDMEILLDISTALNSSLRIDDVLNLIMDSALTFTSAERGFIMLRDASGSFTTRLSRYLASNRNVAGEESVSMSVVERCLATGSPVVIHSIDAFSDFADNRSIIDQNLKSILCMPLIFKGVVRGVLYLDSQQHKTPFKAIQLDVLSFFAAAAATALENAILYEMATVDALTGVFKRDHFENRLKEEFQRAVRHGSPLSLIFMDVDHFKNVNDTLGHPMGDSMLQAVGQVLKSLARNTDIVARWGGEEFVLLAPETRGEYVSALAERIRQTIQTHAFGACDPPTKLTLSLGVATFPSTHVKDPAGLIGAADRALLDAKRQGRNRVCLASA